MKKALKYIAISVVSLLVLLSVLPLCIYIPAIQQWGKNEICNYVERSTGMHLTLGRLALKFPFKLQINDILLLATQQDTLLQSAQIQVGVAPAALLKGNVQINQIALQETRFNFTSADSTLSLSARIKEFSTRNATLHLKDSRIVLPDSRLDYGDIVLKLSESPTDTAEESEPLPWKISAGSIVLSNIHYAMQMQPTIKSLDASIGEASLRQGDIDLYRQKVDVAEFLIEQGDYRYYPGSGEPDNGNDTSNTTTPPDSIVSPPWTIQVKQIRLHHNSLLYALPVQVPQKGFDPGYIALNNIEIAIDSFYNCGSTITVPIKQLAFIERSGLAVQHTRGLFSMDSTGIALTDFQLKTTLSEISAQIHVGEGIFAQEPQTPVEAQLNARIAVGDIITALPEYTPYTRGLLLSSGLVSEFSASGQLGDLSLQKGELSFPGIFSLHTTGKVINLPNTDKLGGTLAWEMKIPESPLIARLLPDSLQERIHIPATRFSGKARLSEAFIQAQVLVEAGQGNIGLQARLNTQKEISPIVIPPARLIGYTLGLGPIFGVQIQPCRFDGSCHCRVESRRGPLRRIPLFGHIGRRKPEPGEARRKHYLVRPEPDNPHRPASQPVARQLYGPTYRALTGQLGSIAPDYRNLQHRYCDCPIGIGKPCSRKLSSQPCAGQLIGITPYLETAKRIVYRLGRNRLDPHECNTTKRGPCHQIHFEYRIK